ncbi:ribonucleotide reductase, partial [Mycena galericulata]
TDNTQDIAIQTALKCSRLNPSYFWIASHIEISKMHKALQKSFSKSMQNLRDESGKPLLTDDFLAIVHRHRIALDDAIVHMRDYDHNYEEIRNLQDHFLTRSGPGIIERIQHMYMRIAVAVHQDDIPSVLSTYDLLSSRQIVHGPLISLLGGMVRGVHPSAAHTMIFTNVDVNSMYEAIAKCVFTVRNGGTVATAAQAVPCSGRQVPGQHTAPNIGLWAMLRLMDGALSFARRNSDRRTDLANVCVEPWHLDIRSVLEFHTMHQQGLSDQKSISITLCIPDIFMARVEDDEKWALFCPRDVPQLLKTKGRPFEDAYISYEASDIPRTTLRARDLWDSILRALLLTAGPSIIFKDSSTGKSNMPDVPPDTSLHTNLRTGVVDTFGASTDLSPRNHASIALPSLITRTRTFNFDKLRQLTKSVVVLLNKLHDSAAPRLSSLGDPINDYRPIAIGMEGLPDVFAALRMPYDSPAAGALNTRIAETMYYAALEASCDLAEEHGTYSKFSSSPLADGILQFDMWHTKASTTYLDWTTLRARIQKSGVRNAVMIAIGPGCAPRSYSGLTAAADKPPPRYAAEEAHSSASDTTLSPWLIQELTDRGLWNSTICENIISANGSVQGIDEIPADIKNIYKTAWEIDPECLIRMAIQRAPYVCHTDCLSLYLEGPTPDTLVNYFDGLYPFLIRTIQGDLLVSSWARGLKMVHRLHARYKEQSTLTSSYEDSDREMSFDDVDVVSSSSS